jgi:UDP-glucose 4-epimerase
MKNLLVTGGAGYIGSVCVKELIKIGYNVVVIDNLINGKEELLDSKCKFYKVDLCDKSNVLKVFNENKIDCVIHFAAYKAVEESMLNPVKYTDNITGAINLLSVMQECNCPKIIFSSTAAVYEITDNKILDEKCNVKPENFYGYTKLIIEDLIKQFNQTYGLKYVILRYFNVGGDGGLNYIDPNAQNVLPILMEAIIGKREKFCIFGDDYDTKDGTCIRDYIHILDLIDAHIKAINCTYNEIINLGTSKGYSVKELVDITKKELNLDFKVEFSKRRLGDPSFVVASNTKSMELLGWYPEKTIGDIIKSTANAYGIKKKI